MVALSVALFSGYHLLLVREVRRAPERTASGLAHILRHAWVDSVIEDKRDVIVVQTLRNWITATSMLASSSIIVAIGLLSFLISSNGVPSFLHRLNLLGSASDAVFLSKVLLLTITFFANFMNFSWALRYYNHLTLELNVPPARAPASQIRVCKEMIDRGALHYTLGMRGFYAAILVTLWFFGPVWMLGGTLLMLGVLRWLDHVR